jgi:hypothetical protein
VSEADIDAFAEQGLVADVVGAVAVVRYRFELDWEADGERHHDTGQDLFVLTRDDDRWLVAWRTSIPERDA